MHDQQLIDQTSALLKQRTPASILNDVVMCHDAWREKRCLNLLASEAPMSLAARKLLASSLSSRTAAGHIGADNRVFAGAHFIDQIEALCHALCKRLFQCHWVEHRILGGTQANHIVYASLLKPGDILFSMNPDDGGDSSTHRQSIVSKMGIKLMDIPTDDEGKINLERLEGLFKKQAPKLLSIGYSICLQVPEYHSLFELCKHYGVIAHADCAHELGLIAGKAYPNPLSLGADLMTGSTGKTLSGPQGGLLLWNDEKWSQTLIEHTFPFALGGYQNNRIAALTLTLSELLDYGESYMRCAVSNAKALAFALLELGVSLSRFSHRTQTHQILINVNSNARDRMRRLERCNIITSLASLPGSKGNINALRIGVMECTRLGMSTQHMKTIASSIQQALQTENETRCIKERLLIFRAGFQTLFYCHDNQLP